MNLRVLSPDQYRRMPWKNGGGETIEIAIFPLNADIETFGWRISSASVASDGPFSTFPGVDRTLCVLSGNGISLNVGAGKPQTIGPDSAPFSFPADAAAVARLINGPITDLNVMTRRAVWRHTVCRHELLPDDVLALEADAAQIFVFCQSGVIAVKGRTGLVPVPSGATLAIEGDASRYELQATELTIAFVVQIERENG
jgi:environmental stress-induced protein Ves